MTLALACIGVSPAQMADIVEQRLSRLDRLVVHAEVAVYFAPESATHNSPAEWGAPRRLGEGAIRELRILRPLALEISRSDESQDRLLSAYSTEQVVQQLPQPTRAGRTYFVVHRNAPTLSSYTSVPLLQVFDVQVHESFVPGLNTLRLLRDYPVEVLASDGHVTTYSATVSIPEWGGWVERFDFDLNAQGTPLRFRMERESLDGSGFRFVREIHNSDLIEVNGAEIPQRCVILTSNSLVPHIAVHEIMVCGSAIDPHLDEVDVRIVPATQNSVIWTRHEDLSEDKVTYDDAGQIVATESSRTTPSWRWALLPLTVAGTIFGSLVIALLPAWRKR